MAGNNDGFNLDDMMEIFGEAPAASAVRASEASSLSTAAPVSTISASIPDPEFLTAEEQALLRAYEQRKQERLQRPVPPLPPEPQGSLDHDERRILEDFETARAARRLPPPGQGLVDIEAAENEAFCSMIEETRTIMFSFLVPLIGIKATNNMLNKSVEKARDKAPVVLKDANWQMDGTLREDGSIDAERVLKNIAALAPSTRVDDYLAGLRELVGLRLRAVEAGLGAGAGADLKARLSAARADLVRRPIQDAWVNAFYSRVLA